MLRLINSNFATHLRMKWIKIIHEHELDEFFRTITLCPYHITHWDSLFTEFLSCIENEKYHCIIINLKAYTGESLAKHLCRLRRCSRSSGSANVIAHQRRCYWNLISLITQLDLWSHLEHDLLPELIDGLFYPNAWKDIHLWRHAPTPELAIKSANHVFSSYRDFKGIDIEEDRAERIAITKANFEFFNDWCFLLAILMWNPTSEFMPPRDFDFYSQWQRDSVVPLALQRAAQVLWVWGTKCRKEVLRIVDWIIVKDLVHYEDELLDVILQAYDQERSAKENLAFVSTALKERDKTSIEGRRLIRAALIILKSDYANLSLIYTINDNMEIFHEICIQCEERGVRKYLDHLALKNLLVYELREVLAGRLKNRRDWKFTSGPNSWKGLPDDALLMQFTHSISPVQNQGLYIPNDVILEFVSPFILRNCTFPAGFLDAMKMQNNVFLNNL